MSYLIYNGKRVISSNKYVTKASISPDWINRLTGWNNISFDTFSSEGINIISAIESASSYGQCRSNTYYITGGWPDYGSINFEFYLNSISGTPPRVQTWKDGVVQGTYSFTYSGPGEYQIGQMVAYSTSSGNWAVGFINELGPAAANFTVSNARMYVHQGDGNSF